MGSTDSIPDSDALFRSFFNQTAVGMAQVDLSGRWLRVNRKLGDIVGYTPEEMATRSFQEITHPEDLGADLDFMRKLLAGEISTCIFEKRFIHKDGKSIGPM